MMMRRVGLLGGLFAIVCAGLLAFPLVKESMGYLLYPLAFFGALVSAYTLSAFSGGISAIRFNRVWVAGIVLLFLPYLGLQRLDYLDVLIQMAMFSTLAMALNLVVGMVGLLDLGFIAFFAVGAYAWGILGSAQLAEIWTGFTGFALCSIAIGGSGCAVGVACAESERRLFGVSHVGFW
jgi:branched-chain amino acid transport system permease protein